MNEWNYSWLLSEGGVWVHPRLGLLCPSVLMDLEAHLSSVTGNWMLWPAEEKQVLDSVWYTEQTGITSVGRPVKSRETDILHAKSPKQSKQDGPLE